MVLKTFLSQVSIGLSFLFKFLCDDMDNDLEKSFKMIVLLYMIIDVSQGRKAEHSTAEAVLQSQDNAECKWGSWTI